MAEQAPFAGSQRQMAEKQGRFFQRLHPLAALLYVFVLFVLVMFSDNPLYLVLLLMIIGLAIWSADGLKDWETSLVFGLTMTIMIIIINALFVRSGDTILWYGPHVPVIGKMNVSLEAIFFGIVMGLRLLAVISVFVLYTCMVHPDKILSVFARFTSKSALVLTMSTRLFPLFRQRLHSIREVQMVRGVDYRQGAYLERLRKYAALYNNLLVTSLEDALEMAEAMQARGYGVGKKRSRYQADIWRPRDSIVAASSAAALLIGVYGTLSGVSRFEFYPILGYLISSSMSVVILALITGLLSVPLMAGWGWHRWSFIKSKI
jgi:energy-coupling factor transport system permease protein